MLQCVYFENDFRIDKVKVLVKSALKMDLIQVLETLNAFYPSVTDLFW